MPATALFDREKEARSKTVTIPFTQVSRLLAYARIRRGSVVSKLVSLEDVVKKYLLAYSGVFVLGVAACAQSGPGSTPGTGGTSSPGSAGTTGNGGNTAGNAGTTGNGGSTAGDAGTTGSGGDTSMGSGGSSTA